MYIIINKTQNTIERYKGNAPNLDEELDNGDEVIFISLYSNTIKVPYQTTLNGITDWNWTDYQLPVSTIVDNTLCVDCRVNYRSSGIDVCPSCETYRHMDGQYDDYDGGQEDY
jgi:hypothetical protein